MSFNPGDLVYILPLIILAVPTVIAGFFGIATYLAPEAHAASHGMSGIPCSH